MKRAAKISMLVLTLLALEVSAQEQHQSVGSHADSSIVTGTLAALQADGLIRAEQVDRTWVAELASQKLDERRTRRIHLVTFTLRSGEEVEAIARSEQSPIVEQTGLVVYVISKVLQPDGKPVPAHQ